MNSNYVHTVEGSQHYTTLEQLLQTLKLLRENTDRYDLSATVRGLKSEIDYIIKGIENSINNGYYIGKYD